MHKSTVALENRLKRTKMQTKRKLTAWHSTAWTQANLFNIVMPLVDRFFLYYSECAVHENLPVDTGVITVVNSSVNHFDFGVLVSENSNVHNARLKY